VATINGTTDGHGGEKLKIKNKSQEYFFGSIFWDSYPWGKISKIEIENYFTFPKIQIPNSQFNFFIIHSPTTQISLLPKTSF